jgi:hypothetical protein
VDPSLFYLLLALFPTTLLNIQARHVISVYQLYAHLPCSFLALDKMRARIEVVVVELGIGDWVGHWESNDTHLTSQAHEIDEWIIVDAIGEEGIGMRLLITWCTAKGMG